MDGRLETILGSTPETLSSLLDKIGVEKSTKAPAPGKWSAAEIVAHLADCELVFAFRLRQTLAEDGPVIQPFDQDKWAADLCRYYRFGCADHIRRHAQLESGSDPQIVACCSGTHGHAS